MTSNQVGRQRIGLNPAVPSSTLFQWMADLAFRCLFVFLCVRVRACMRACMCVSYILKVKKLVESIQEPKKIGGKSA